MSETEYVRLTCDCLLCCLLCALVSLRTETSSVRCYKPNGLLYTGYCTVPLPPRRAHSVRSTLLARTSVAASYLVVVPALRFARVPSIHRTFAGARRTVASPDTHGACICSTLLSLPLRSAGVRVPCKRRLPGRSRSANEGRRISHARHSAPAHGRQSLLPPAESPRQS